MPSRVTAKRCSAPSGASGSISISRYVNILEPFSSLVERSVVHMRSPISSDSMTGSISSILSFLARSSSTCLPLTTFAKVPSSGAPYSAECLSLVNIRCVFAGSEPPANISSNLLWSAFPLTGATLEEKGPKATASLLIQRTGMSLYSV